MADLKAGTVHGKDKTRPNEVWMCDGGHSHSDIPLKDGRPTCPECMATHFTAVLAPKRCSAEPVHA